MLSRFHRGEAERREAEQREAERREEERREAERREAQQREAARREAERREAARREAERREAERREAERREAERREVQQREAERREEELQREAEAAAEELRRRATALGLLQVLTNAGVADDATLKKSIAWCDEEGVTNVSDIVKHKLVDKFVLHLGLKNVPGMELRSLLQRAPMSNRGWPSIPSWLTSFGLPVAGNGAADEKYQRALQEDGFALRALLPGTDKSTLKSLEALLKIDRPKWLGKGNDVSKTYGPYDKLKLACAWEVNHPLLRSKYTAGSLTVQQELRQLQNRGKDVTTVPGLPVKTARVRGFELSEDCNEVILLHGVNREKLFNLLSTGLNERFAGIGAGAAFGAGVYLAEDAGKTDQYVSADSAYDPSSELHKRLYDETMPHPEDVFYVLVVRAALGFPVRTQHTGEGATSMDNEAPIFPVAYRELSAVPGVNPPIFHHSLIAELGKDIVRYREFVFFHSDYVHIDYVIAYHRYNGDQKLRTTVCPVSV